MNQSEVREILNYDEKTGEFTWRTKISHKVVIGRLAGHINDSGYRIIKIKGIRYRAHRLAWLYIYGEWPEQQIDHINGRREDNRIINLRSATPRDNSKNQKRRVDNQSGCTGISKHSLANRWVAQITLDGKSTYLGIYEDFFEACCARKAAEKKHGFHENHGRHIKYKPEN